MQAFSLRALTTAESSRVAQHDRSDGQRIDINLLPRVRQPRTLGDSGHVEVDRPGIEAVKGGGVAVVITAAILDVCQRTFGSLIIEPGCP